MPRPCTVCHHEARNEIEEALASGISHRKVAEHFDLSASAVFRHQKKHPLVGDTRTNEVGPEKTLSERVKKLESLSDQMVRCIRALDISISRIEQRLF